MINQHAYNANDKKNSDQGTAVVKFDGDKLHPRSMPGLK